jgi:predicted PurR-regulated permease PerM
MSDAVIGAAPLVADLPAEEIGAIAPVIEPILAEAPPAPTPVEAPKAMPLPTEPRTIFLGGLFLLASLAALYVAADIVLPIVLAIVLKLLLQPLVRVFDRLHLPRGIGALFAVILLIGVLAGLVSALSGPAADWAGRLPHALPRIQEQLAFLKRPIAAVQALLHQAESLATGATADVAPPGPVLPARGSNLMDVLFSGTRAVAASLFTTLLVLFYLLVSGETFLRRLVEVLPRFAAKRQAVEMSIQIERHISAYLLTVTLINAAVGVLTGIVMWLCGVGDPLLWGTVAFVVNYVPILGPMAGMVLFAAAGVLSLGATWAAALPVGLYFAIHVIEGELATPMLLARRFTINPVAIILTLVFWYWMWGVPGAILAVPMLAIVKIVCDDITPLRAFGHFLEG